MSIHTTSESVSIVEETPVWLVASSRRNAAKGVVALAGTGCSIHMAVLVPSGSPYSFAHALAIWLAFALAGLGIASILHSSLKRQLPRLELRANTIFVRYGRRSLEANINDCHVRRGRAGGMRLAGGVVCFSRHPVILIDLPPWWNSLLAIRRRPRDINTVAVGYTEAMKAQWERALLQYMTNSDVHRSTASSVMQNDAERSGDAGASPPCG